MSSLQRFFLTMRREAIAITSSIDTLSEPHILRFVDALRSCQGKVVVTGMGKIGYVGARFAMTLASTGTPAFFLHPGEAQHGDLGILSSGDVLVACSNSGKTREVIETVQQARIMYSAADVPIIGVVGPEESDLCEHVDFAVVYGVVTEACPLGLTPTSSLAVVSALLDGIALALMEQGGMTKQDYAVRHHGGYLGEQARK